MLEPHPSRLVTTPIVESNLEIRFKSSVPDSAVPGMIYNTLRESYPEMEPTNVLEIPESIRSNAPELMYAPLYRLVGNKMVSVGIGSNVLTIYYNKELHNGNYPGWTSYIHREIMDVCTKINEIDIISETTRLGLRTVDFFDEMNIFDQSELDLNFNGSSILNDVSILERNVVESDFNSRIIVNSKASRKTGTGTKIGSVVDIDTNVKLDNNIFNNPNDMIMKCHKENKKIFFDLLKEEFINTLDPRK